MTGQQPLTESLFYYFPLQDQIPEDHLLRLIDGHIDFSFAREQLKNSCSAMGRPSIRRYGHSVSHASRGFRLWCGGV